MKHRVFVSTTILAIAVIWCMFDKIRDQRYTIEFQREYMRMADSVNLSNQLRMDSIEHLPQYERDDKRVKLNCR